MKYTYKDTMRIFNCSRKDIVRALNKYGYYTKNSIIDDKCIDYLGKYFDNPEEAFPSEISYSSKENSLDEIMKKEFIKDCRSMLNTLEYTEENFYIDELYAKAKIVNFSDDNCFNFLREYYPELYRSAKDAAVAY